MINLGLLPNVCVEPACMKIGRVLELLLHTSLELRSDSHLCHTYFMYGHYSVPVTTTLGLSIRSVLTRFTQLWAQSMSAFNSTRHMCVRPWLWAAALGGSRYDR